MYNINLHKNVVFTLRCTIHRNGFHGENDFLRALPVDRQSPPNRIPDNIARSERNIYLIIKTCQLDTGELYSIVYDQSAKMNTFLTISVISYGYNPKYVEKVK